MKNQEFALFILHNYSLSEMQSLQSFVGEKVNANHGEAAKPSSLDLLHSRIHREISTTQHFKPNNFQCSMGTKTEQGGYDFYLMDLWEHRFFFRGCRLCFTKAYILFPAVANN